MYVITADQVDSRHSQDAVAPMIRELAHAFGRELALPPDRTAGDELQTATRIPKTAIEVVLQLSRDDRWSVGVGIGTTTEPLGPSTRESTGPAFVAAREAVTRAKKKSSRFAVANEVLDAGTPDFESTFDLLLLLRSRRSDEGWELFDLLRAGISQSEAAKQLGITPQAASSRARAAEIKAETSSIPAFERQLAELDRSRS